MIDHMTGSQRRTARLALIQRAERLRTTEAVEAYIALCTAHRLAGYIGESSYLTRVKRARVIFDD